MKRMTNLSRSLALTALLAAFPLALSAQTTFHVNASAAGPGDGSPGDPFTIVQDAIDALSADGDTISIAGGTYAATSVFSAAHNNLTANFDGLKFNDITVTGDPNNRPVFEGGIFFANDTHTGFTLENIVVRARTTTNADTLAYLVDSTNQTGATVGGDPNLGRRDMTISNCVFDGQNMGEVPATGTNTSTNGLRIFQVAGTLIFEDNYITGLTGNVIFSPTGAGSVHANDFGATPKRMLSEAHVRRNQIVDSTGAIDTRGYHFENSFEDTSENPVMYFTDNHVSGVPPSNAPSGGVFKIFHAKEGYFYGNTIQGTAVTQNAYGPDPCDATLDNRNRGAGIMFLNVGTLIAAGNEFIDCLQGLCHDPHGGTLATDRPWTQSIPKDFQVLNNTFTFCDLAVYFPPRTRQGWTHTGTCVSWAEDLGWNAAEWNNPVVFRNNNFINNEFSILSQAADGTDIEFDLDENYWGDPAGPGPGDIVLERESNPENQYTADDPKPTLVLADSDGDGIPDWQEILIYGTDPHNPDSSGDGIPDGVAVANGLDPNINYADNPGELPSGTDLSDFVPDYTLDSDGDGFADWYEIAKGTDPNDPNSYPSLGDADGNGQLDNVDALIITGIVVGAPGFDLNKFNFSDLDVNRDGVVNNVDAIILINHFLGNIPVLPLPPAE
jgi:hypothetical protein